jgi:hypothetical protein
MSNSHEHHKPVFPARGDTSLGLAKNYFVG